MPTKKKLRKPLTKRRVKRRMRKTKWAGTPLFPDTPPEHNAVVDAVYAKATVILPERTDEQRARGLPATEDIHAPAKAPAPVEFPLWDLQSAPAWAAAYAMSPPGEFINQQRIPLTILTQQPTAQHCMSSRRPLLSHGPVLEVTGSPERQLAIFQQRFERLARLGGMSTTHEDGIAQRDKAIATEVAHLMNAMRRFFLKTDEYASGTKVHRVVRLSDVV